MTNKKLYTAGIVFLFVLVVGFAARGVLADETKAPVKTAAVLELEKEMARDVPVYNEVAPRLKMNRAALEQLGWHFDDTTLEARPL